LVTTLHRAEFLGWLSLPLHEKRSDLELYVDASPASETFCPGLAGRLAWACNPTTIPHSQNRLSYFHYLHMAPPDVSPYARRLFVYSLVAALGVARAERYKPPGNCQGLSQLKSALAMILAQRGSLQCCLKTISWQSHISASYLAALFSTVVGVTFREYVKSVRLSCAAESMRSSNARIVEVSSELGYTVPSNFVRDFRCGFGVCPAKWRGSYSDDFLWPPLDVTAGRGH
jgi:AraC-like DNA-binding protein